MDSFHDKNQYNAIAWSYPVASIDQIDYSFFNFDIPELNHFKLITILKAI